MKACRFVMSQELLRTMLSIPAAADIRGVSIEPATGNLVFVLAGIGQEYEPGLQMMNAIPTIHSELKPCGHSEERIDWDDLHFFP